VITCELLIAAFPVAVGGDIDELEKEFGSCPTNIGREGSGFVTGEGSVSFCKEFAPMCGRPTSEILDVVLGIRFSDRSSPTYLQAILGGRQYQTTSGTLSSNKVEWPA
jgi:hypothetical protein